MEMEDYLKKELCKASSSMFTKNFMGIFHGSISVKVEDDKFIINSKDAVFDSLNNNDFITLYTKKDYRWKSASMDANIHLNIYKNISEAKYISYTMPPFITSLSLKKDIIKPKDYFGSTIIGELEVYDPKNFDTWYKRADEEIYMTLLSTQKDMLLIKGYGLISYNRDLMELIKKVAILENSAKLIYYSKNIEKDRKFSLS